MSVINKKALSIAAKYFSGDLKSAEFALTNVCIAKCSFCDIWKQTPKIIVDPKKAKRTIKRLSEFGVGHITFTGGEPLLHPNIIDFVGLASKLNVHNAVLDAVPRLLIKNEMFKRLEAAGCDLVSISFDSSNPKTMAKSRNIENIMDEMKQAMDIIRKTSLNTMASVLIWNDNYNKLEGICRKAKNMGYNFISFNYPTFSDSKVYTLGGEGINFPRENVIEGLESAIRLKESGKYNIINSVISMKNIISYLKDPASVKFDCLGGSRVLFVDWFFNVYPCMQLPEAIGNVFEINKNDLNLPACNACNMSWYRDISMYFYGIRSIPIIFDSFKKSGQLL